MPELYIEGTLPDGTPYGPVFVVETPLSESLCKRCLGEEVIWNGCYGNGDSNYFDPCPDCQGFDPDEDVG